MQRDPKPTSSSGNTTTSRAGEGDRCRAEEAEETEEEEERKRKITDKRREEITRDIENIKKATTILSRISEAEARITTLEVNHRYHNSTMDTMNRHPEVTSEDNREEEEIREIRCRKDKLAKSYNILPEEVC